MNDECITSKSQTAYTANIVYQLWYWHYQFHSFPFALNKSIHPPSVLVLALPLQLSILQLPAKIKFFDLLWDQILAENDQKTSIIYAAESSSPSHSRSPSILHQFWFWHYHFHFLCYKFPLRSSFPSICG